jgi:tetratricopeptide (TPR) repeat protein
MGATSILSAFARPGWRGMEESLPDVRAILDDGLRHHLAGRIKEAAVLYRRAIALKPDYLEAHNNLGVALASMGKIDEAMARYRGVLSLDPDYADALGNLAAALLSKGKPTDAIAYYKRLLLLKPDHAAAHYSLGVALDAQGGTDAAIERYERAIALKPDYAAAHNNLAVALASKGNSSAALAHYRIAVASDPNHAEAHNNLGNLYRELGRFDDALAHYGRAIEIRPDSVEAHYHRAEIKSFRRGDPDLAALENLAAREDLPANEAPYVHFALARAFEDTGDYARAFGHLRKGNDSRRRQINYDEPRIARMFERIKSVFDRALLDRFEGSGDPSEAPIFVLGMPRSGSTLIEQMLAGHPQIHAAGELGDLEKAVGRPAPFPECVLAFDESALRKIGADYLARMPVLANGETRIVNKLPDNFLRIGLIRLILPNARIIHTMRDPIDTCVSCYSKLFASGQYFTYNMGELGRYYNRYRELMDHWKSVLPREAMLEVSYEDVVNDVEGQARRLIEYCGLPWDDRCVNFHETSRPVKTASAVQVRKPLFRSSLQRWRKYEAEIGSLREALNAEDFHHVRAADTVQFGFEFPVGTNLGGHVEDYGKVA